MLGELAVQLLPQLAHLVPGWAPELYPSRSRLASKQRAPWSYCAGVLCAGLLGVACAGRHCESQSPVMVADRESGFVHCEGGWFHRPRRVEFFPSVPRHNVMCCSLVDAHSGENGCRLDAECTDGQYGRCTLIVLPAPGEQEIGCRCEYGGCLSDAECRPDQLCAPPGVTEDPVGTCVPASCRDDSDCGDVFCSSMGGGRGFACQHPDDECDSDRDCLPLFWEKKHWDWGYRCHLSESDGRRRCSGSSAGQILGNGPSATTPVLARPGTREHLWPVWR